MIFFFLKVKVKMCSPAKMTNFNQIIAAGNTDPKLEASMKCNLCLTPIKDLEIGFSVASLLLFTIQNLIKLKQAIFVLPNNVFILLDNCQDTSILEVLILERKHCLRVFDNHSSFSFYFFDFKLYFWKFQL